MSKNSAIIDVIIPAHKKDIHTLNYCIDGIRRNVKSIRRIIVISQEKFTDKAEWFDESLYPFSYQEISDLVFGSNVGWNFQQLLKLYSPLVIPNISENVLVVDADTIFYRKVKFFEDGVPLYNLSKDKNLESSNFHQTTFRHIQKILPEISEKFPKNFENISGICHHMLFQKHIVEELFARVEKHDASGDPFYKIFLKNRENSFGVAEYNLYFYFLISFYPKNYKIRILKYKNTSAFNPLIERLRHKYHYCSYHSYMRKKNKEYFLEKVKKLFQLEQWNIGVINFPIHEILQKKLEIKWLNPPRKSTFHADPFGFEIDGKKYIIFEYYSRILKRGKISIADFDGEKLTNKRIILDDKKHLSYPFIFHHGDNVYMTCESSKSQKLNLYLIDKKTIQLKKIREIFFDKGAIDPVIFFHKEKFWIFYTTSAGADYELNIAFSDSLFGEFKDHPKNPVKLDKMSARSAGNIFVVNGEIYRPSQNCSNSYGGSIVINRITKLDEENFSEEFVRELKPDPQSEYCSGLHTISQFGNMTLIDGRRKIFTLQKPAISFLAGFKKIFL